MLLVSLAYAMKIINNSVNRNHTIPQQITTNANQVSIRYGKVTTARQYISVFSFLILIFCLINNFQAIFTNSLFSYLGIVISLLSIVLGLLLIILLIFELLSGAGIEIEMETEKDEETLLEYQFIPSLHKLPLLLLFLVIGFFSIILGFASLYAELYRQNPDNFFGLQDGFLSIYFSLVTFSTVGYGDIFPASVLTRLAAMCEIFIAMFFSLIALSTTLSWVTAHERSQHEEFLKKRVQEIQNKRKCER